MTRILYLFSDPVDTHTFLILTVDMVLFFSQTITLPRPGFRYSGASESKRQ